MNRALSALGLARRAGKLNWGFDTAVEAMRSGACGVVILAAIGKKAGVLAVCDRGFAEKLKQLIADGEREEMRI